MGYDLTLVAGRVTKNMETDGRAWFAVKSTFEYRPGYDSAILNLKPTDPVPVYFYSPAGDGNTQISKDCYDTKCVAVADKPVLAALKKDARGSEYHEAAWLWAEAIVKGAAPEEVQFVLWGS